MNKPLEYLSVQTDPDRCDAEVNGYAEKGWRLVAIVAMTPSRWRIMLERRRGDK